MKRGFSDLLKQERQPKISKEDEIAAKVYSEFDLDKNKIGMDAGTMVFCDAKDFEAPYRLTFFEVIPIERLDGSEGLTNALIGMVIAIFPRRDNDTLLGQLFSAWLTLPQEVTLEEARQIAISLEDTEEVECILDIDDRFIDEYGIPRIPLKLAIATEVETPSSESNVRKPRAFQAFLAFNKERSEVYRGLADEEYS
jgi:hypothetical protein